MVTVHSETPIGGLHSRPLWVFLHHTSTFHKRGHGPHSCHSERTGHSNHKLSVETHSSSSPQTALFHYYQAGPHLYLVSQCPLLSHSFLSYPNVSTPPVNCITLLIIFESLSWAHLHTRHTFLLQFCQFILHPLSYYAYYLTADSLGSMPPPASVVSVPFISLPSCTLTPLSSLFPPTHHPFPSITSTNPLPTFPSCCIPRFHKSQPNWSPDPSSGPLWHSKIFGR